MKNIILLITDTYRFDNLFDRAQKPVRTPELDRFATEQATEVMRFITGSFPTIPHRTDVTTGRLGWPNYGWQALPQSSRNAWPQILRNQGYITQLICDCPHLFNAEFQKTFMAAYQERGQEGDCPLLHLNDPILNVMPNDKTRPNPPFKPLAMNVGDQHRWTNRYYKCEEETFSYRTSKTTVRWLEENNETGPFFLWVDFFDPHEPWDPPEYLVRRYQKEYKGAAMIQPNYGRSSDLTADELINLWAHYAAEAELVDRALGRILQKIDDLQLWDDSVVVVTSDHGFSLGEHERTGKTNLNPGDDRRWPIYPEVNHVPFLIAGAGIAKGECRDIIAQPIDILPTVCELAGAPIEPPEEIDGRSFAGAIRGTTTDHRSCAVSSSKMNWAAEELGQCATIPFLTTAKWGYAPAGPTGGEQLFDLDTDPLAETDLAAEQPGVLAEMRQCFRDVLAAEANDQAAAYWARILG